MSRTRLAVLAWLAFVAACVIVIGRTQFTADLSAFLPRSPSPAQQLLVDQLRDGVVSRLILIGIEGAAPESLAKISRAMAATLRKQPAFVAVNNGESSGLEQDRDFLWRNRYLLSPAVTSERFSQAGLRAALEEDLALLASPAGVLVRRILADDPTGELLALIDQLAGQAKPASRDGVWFSGDGRRALLVAQTSAAGYDLDAQEHAIGQLRAAFESAREASHAEGARLHLDRPGRVLGRIEGDDPKRCVALVAHRHDARSRPCCSPSIAHCACWCWASFRSLPARWQAWRPSALASDRCMALRWPSGSP